MITLYKDARGIGCIQGKEDGLYVKMLEEC